MIANNLKLFNYWEKYVNYKKLYRVMPYEYLNNRLDKIDPKNNPYKPIYSPLLELFTLVINYEKSGKIFRLKWRDSKPRLSKVLKLSFNDYYEDCIDFTTSYQEVLWMSNQWKGGALATNLKAIISCLSSAEKEMSVKEKKLLTKLSVWVEKKELYKNVIISINGNLTCLETAKFQHRQEGPKNIYWSSPFGSFDHFAKVTNNELEKYKPYLERGKEAYVRVSEPIYLKDINIVNP